MILQRFQRLAFGQQPKSRRIDGSIYSRLTVRTLTSTTSPDSHQTPNSLPVSDRFQQLPDSTKNGTDEDNLFNHQVQQLRRWWASERFHGTKRSYSAEDVASKRGSLRHEYPSSIMAKKLFARLREKEANKQHIQVRTLSGKVKPVSFLTYWLVAKLASLIPCK